MNHTHTDKRERQTDREARKERDTHTPARTALCGFNYKGERHRVRLESTEKTIADYETTG